MYLQAFNYFSENEFLPQIIILIIISTRVAPPWRHCTKPYKNYLASRILDRNQIKRRRKGSVCDNIGWWIKGSTRGTFAWCFSSGLVRS